MNVYAGDLGETADTTAVLSATADKSLSIDVGFVPKAFQAFISGDAAANRQWNYGSSTTLCRCSAFINGVCGSNVSYLYIQDNTSGTPSASPILNPMAASATTSPAKYLGTFGSGTTTTPGIPEQTLSATTSKVKFKNVSVSGNTLTFTWTFTRGDIDVGYRIGVHRLMVWG